MGWWMLGCSGMVLGAVVLGAQLVYSSLTRSSNCCPLTLFNLTVDLSAALTSDRDPLSTDTCCLIPFDILNATYTPSTS